MKPDAFVDHAQVGPDSLAHLLKHCLGIVGEFPGACLYMEAGDLNYERHGLRVEASI